MTAHNFSAQYITYCSVNFPSYLQTTIIAQSILILFVLLVLLFLRNVLELLILVSF